jgi:hypothetical protein
MPIGVPCEPTPPTDPGRSDPFAAPHIPTALLLRGITRSALSSLIIESLQPLCGRPTKRRTGAQHQKSRALIRNSRFGN